jgi:hypothetical protein
MGLTIREYTNRDGRGRSRKIQVIAGFDYPDIFDVSYDATLHRHFILREVSHRTTTGTCGKEQEEVRTAGEISAARTFNVESGNPARRPAAERLF